ncbi:MAG: type II toxin-antitoxin system HicA family toxin [Nitrospinae bacterium]|nr:type II toxin-antitoxin system HicA family toxin [Nitrospinota bacterium]
MTSGQIVKAIKKAGWFHVATHGGHWQFKHPEKPGKVTVPHPKKRLPARRDL